MRATKKIEKRKDKQNTVTIIITTNDKKIYTIVLVKTTRAKKKKNHLGVLVHRVPDLADPGTGGVYDLNVLLVQVSHLLQRGAECGKNYDVAIIDRGQVFHALVHCRCLQQ